MGRYAIEATVGSGGFATVYRAVDTALERPVAPPIRSCPAGSSGTATSGSSGAATPGPGGAQTVAPVPGATTAGTATAAPAATGLQPVNAAADGPWRTAGEVLRFVAAALLLLAAGVFLRHWLRPTPAGRHDPFA